MAWLVAGGDIPVSLAGFTPANNSFATEITGYPTLTSNNVDIGQHMLSASEAWLSAQFEIESYHTSGDPGYGLPQSEYQVHTNATSSFLDNLDTTECMGDSFNSSCNFTLPSANASPSQEALLSLDQLFTEFTTQTHEGMRVARDTTPGDPTEWAAESTGNSLRFIPQPSSAVQLDPVADTDPSLDPTHAHYTDFCVRFMQTISHERIDLSTFLTSMLMHGYLDEPRLRTTIFGSQSHTPIRRRRVSPHHTRECFHCGRQKTSQWRRDPVTQNDLCNPCGQQAYNRARTSSSAC
ncbi:hypothetical protein R3P38DRAFT_3076826 [Favolaschia claudopus]|uniref:GATA-type domain-containing protein n=1 Tax=Favolaschia claudopus TaxID=2862362 RepID=A0AAV9ZWN3_9AGAR